MAINLNADFEKLKKWLEENLTDNKRIKASCQEVNKTPETKGIYFWFMHPDAYKGLNIKPIEPKYTRNISGVKYDLVYLGTSGVRNNSNGINRGHLRERIKWHLCDNKNITSLCNKSGSTMSTLRNTIGGLISDDLIGNNTQNKIDELLCKYFFIYYVDYSGTFLEVKDEVSIDEGILIKVIRPLFNLKNNPNADNPTHITYMIQQRRQKIEKDSKKRCCKEKTNNNSKIISSKPIQNLDKENKVILEIDCVTFEVKRTENISIVADSISNLPTGPCSIELFYSNTADTRIYINGKKRNIPTSKRTVSQYFNAPDTANGKIPKWKIVQNEMNESNNFINKIKVNVCKIVNNRNIKSKTENKVVPKSPKVETRNKIQNTSIDNKIVKIKVSNNIKKTNKNNSIYLIPCSSSKISSEELERRPFKIEKLEFNKELGEYRKEFIEKLKKVMAHKRKSQDINNNFDFNFTEQAHKIYSKGNLYHRNSSDSLNWKKSEKEKIYIVSALFGIIRADNYIPLYDIAMTDEIDGVKNFAKKYWKGKLDTIIEKICNDGNIVNNLLSNDYNGSINKKTKNITTIPNIKYIGSDASEKRGKWLKKELGKNSLN